MRAFTCPDCSSLVPFDATRCLVSDSDLGYSRADRAMVVLHDGRTAGGLVRCTNSDIAACNWLTTPDEPLCDCCRLTRTRPADGDTAALPMFARTETAKRRLLYQLDDLGLPVVGRDGDPEGGLAFDLLSSAHENVVIGHASGVVTIDLAEGDDGYREQLRIRLAEPYRTMLGHLRHETGHWYWEVLVDRPGNTDAFRALFGDERVSYADALERHYGGEPPAGWSGTSPPTPPRTRGRTGPSRSPTTCTSATPSRPRRPTGWSSRARTGRHPRRRRWRRCRASSRRPSTRSSRPGCR